MGVTTTIRAFDRSFMDSDDTFSRIGGGVLGGKAQGLFDMEAALEIARRAGRFGDLSVEIPRSVVVATDVYETFMERNRLHDVARSGEPDERIASAFQKADLPPEILGDLRALVDEVRTPLALRSSSLLEDALERPFAGVYETKMIPNNQPSPDERFRRLTEAMKLVWASTWFAGAREYRRASKVGDDEERMAVLIQEVVGERFGDRFYPHLSAVCRSFNYYPTGGAPRSDGYAGLALGLGKTIVDGGLCWSYSPRHPHAPPPFGSTREMLADTQRSFWAVNMGPPPPYDPIAETEYLVAGDLAEAEYDGTLRYVASTYDAESDRLRPGVYGPGPRVLDFAPLLRLREVPLNDALVELLEVCAASAGKEVEIETAATLPGPRGGRARVGFVQVRPMAAPDENVSVLPAELEAPANLLVSERTMGHGVVEGIRDVVYLRPGFELAASRRAAVEVEERNRILSGEDRPYLLIGFGRWGSSDPWLGVPVRWNQISGARALVEATLPGRPVDPSQGSHFFHNLSSFGVVYLAVREVDWDWLATRNVVHETEVLRHVRLDAPLDVRVDGRSGRGLVRRRSP